MAQDLAYEDSEVVFFLTTRTMNSKLWFINNPQLENRILAYLARFQEMYGVVIYAFVLMGNHYHLIARFPNRNKRAFFMAFNSMLAKLTKSHVRAFEGGKLWARPVRPQALGNERDVKDRVFYAALNPVNAGLVERIEHYPYYNSFADAVSGTSRTFKIFLREDYSNRKRHNRALRPADCTVEHTLTFSRLPGFEHLSQSEYQQQLKDELELLRKGIVAQRHSEGKGFLTRRRLLDIMPGTSPRSTKTSTRNSKRPLILTSSLELKQQFLDWYFAMKEAYRDASLRFRRGELNVVFPTGTYRPPSFCAA